MKKRIISLALVLNLLLVSALPVAVSAQSDSGDMTLSYEITSTYSIVVPATVSFTSAPSISSAAYTDPFTITITSNDTTSGGIHHATIKVRGNDGKLSTGVDLNVLSPALQIDSTTLGWTDLEIGSADSPASNSLDAASGSAQATGVIITQPSVTFPSNIPAGVYQEVLTFTAEFSPG